jgi:hypothetical protein
MQASPPDLYIKKLKIEYAQRVHTNYRNYETIQEKYGQKNLLNPTKVDVVSILQFIMQKDRLCWVYRQVQKYIPQKTIYFQVERPDCRTSML